MKTEIAQPAEPIVQRKILVKVQERRRRRHGKIWSGQTKCKQQIE